MKFFSLFKSPQHQSFEYRPRYYDPAKEDLDRRVARAKRSAEGGRSEVIDGNYSSIRDAFSKRRSRGGNPSVLRMILVLLLTGTFVCWIFFGNAVFYFYFLAAPVYVYFRFKKRVG